MYPNLTLNISDHKPTLFLKPEAEISRAIVSSEDSIKDLIFSIVEQLNLKTELKQDFKLEDILALASEGDERMIEVIPENDTYGKSFGFVDFVNRQLQEAKKSKDDFSRFGSNIEKDVLNALHVFQNIDILASMIEMIYNILIARVILAANDLSIKNIILEDECGYPRLAGKMSSELAKEGLSLTLSN
ncbi:MAG: hypothetical protein Kow0081_0210 [Candidatus Dojkabacteria bacterium]